MAGPCIITPPPPPRERGALPSPPCLPVLLPYQAGRLGRGQQQAAGLRSPRGVRPGILSRQHGVLPGEQSMQGSIFEGGLPAGECKDRA